VVANVVDFKITGHKFEDRNANGKLDAGEPGIAGWTFYLDANDNGQLDAGETTTQTDANGDYAFTGSTRQLHRSRGAPERLALLDAEPVRVPVHAHARDPIAPARTSATGTTPRRGREVPRPRWRRRRA